MKIKPRYTVIIYMPAYQYCNVANAVNNKSAFMVAIELDKKQFTIHIQSH